LENNKLMEELKRLGLSDYNIESIEKLYKTLQKVLKNDEFIKNDMDFIADGYNAEIDRLRKIAYHSDEMLMDYQNELATVSKVSNVKLKYIINQGYFIEITNKDIQLFESNLASIVDTNNEKFNIVRRNTLKGAQRYNSEFLEKIESKIIDAKSALVEQEFLVLQELKESIGTITNDLNTFANHVAFLDLYTSHAIFSKENNLVKASYSEKGDLEIVEGRHLVVEKFLDQGFQFIPNDLFMDGGSGSNKGQDQKEFGFVHIITGPNMGGKSTYLRQNALIVLMAHCGFFVPAKSAKISLVDGIFARIGSGDNLAKNQSTFMTEMIEVANILNNATKNSFVIFDELGRGTSTYDGLALTKAILEYIVTEIKSKTLIATHYHELIALEEVYEGIKNYSVSVYETDKDVVFMKKIVKGGADKSYGLDVAKLAGIPNIILQRAEENLNNLHSSTDKKNIKNLN
ncbi:MAG TPA: hypothetical protein PLP73_04325, partial [Candidatus Absconditabacterales bacterium]|nr:hypothetical protein [Candidatus Absconditabacterales bacterium]